MTNLIIPENESHFYYPSGEPCYELPRADGMGFRRATIRDARQLNLLPSVTTLLGVLHKPGLAAWINMQYVLAALTLPRDTAESVDEFAKRVVTDAGSVSRVAAQSGTAIHRLIEWWLSISVSTDPTLIEVPPMSISERAVLDGFRLWARENHVRPESLERSFVRHFASPELGYGGRIDFVGEVNGVRLVVDWKTQETKPGKPIMFYPESGCQVKAYAHGIGEPDTPGLTVVLSRNEPGRIQSYLWTEDWLWPAFEACKYIWYTPLGGGGRLRGTDGEQETD